MKRKQRSSEGHDQSQADCELVFALPHERPAPRCVGHATLPGSYGRVPSSSKLRRLGLNLDRTAIARIELGTRKLRDYEMLALIRVLDIAPSHLAAAYQSASAMALSKAVSKSSSKRQKKSNPVCS